MENDVKEILAKAMKIKKQCAEGIDIFEQNICFGMHDNYQSVRSMIKKERDEPSRKKNQK